MGQSAAKHTKYFYYISYERSTTIETAILNDPNCEIEKILNFDIKICME